MSPALSVRWNQHLLVFVTASPLPLFQWIEPTSISFIISEAPPAVKVSHIEHVLLESATLSSVGIDAYY